jgi:hypothetical protein
VRDGAGRLGWADAEGAWPEVYSWRHSAKSQLVTNQADNIKKLSFGGIYTYMDCEDGGLRREVPQIISSESRRAKTS